MVYVILICIAVPLALMLPLLDKQARWLVGFMMIGAAVAVSAAEINRVLGAAMSMTAMEASLIVAPVTEELMKAAPVLLFAILVTDDRRRVLPLSMATGIGFAILENCYILVNNAAAVDLSWALLRGFSTSLIHAMSTFLVGCGIIFVRKQKKLFYTGTFALLAAAITLHATFNLLIYSPWDAAGMLLPIVIYAAVQLIRWRKRVG